MVLKNSAISWHFIVRVRLAENGGAGVSPYEAHKKLPATKGEQMADHLPTCDFAACAAPDFNAQKIVEGPDAVALARAFGGAIGSHIAAADRLRVDIRDGGKVGLGGAKQQRVNYVSEESLGRKIMT